jgi:hypothetical protein
MNEIDVLVAEKVMGWKRMRWCDWQKDTRTSLTYSWHDTSGQMTELAEDSNDYYNPKEAWSPSTDIAEAWQVAEFLTKKWQHWSLVNYGNRWEVYENPYDVGDYPPDSVGETAQLAICLAALKAVGGRD